MTTFTDVFERKEVKYRLDARQHRAMAATLRGRMAPDAFGRTRIVSRYFDTPERALIERSLDKPLYKEKLRLRSYGSSQADDRVFVEIKKKYKGIVYKRRVGCSLAAAEAYLGGESYEQACARFPLPDPAMAAESLSPRSVQIARVRGSVPGVRGRSSRRAVVCDSARVSSGRRAEGRAVRRGVARPPPSSLPCAVAHAYALLRCLTVRKSLPLYPKGTNCARYCIDLDIRIDGIARCGRVHR